MEPCAFYCVTDARYFLGAVALLNSLRIAGHDEPFYVLDAGLDREQQDLLAGAASVVASPTPIGRPTLAKWVVPLLRPARAMVLLDSDVIVLGPLAPVLEDVLAGRVVAFADNQPPRSHAAWANAVGVESIPRRTYVNAGLLGLPEELARGLLDDVARLQRQARGGGGTGSKRDPFHFADQDVWNAVIGARVPDESLRVLDHRLAPFVPYEARGLRVLDAQRLDCRYPDGSSPLVLHHIGPKPWLATTRPSVYARLLPRLLDSGDLAVRVPRRLLPFRLRRGLLPRVERVGRETTALVGARLRASLPD